LSGKVGQRSNGGCNLTIGGYRVEQLIAPYKKQENDRKDKRKFHQRGARVLAKEHESSSEASFAILSALDH